MKKIILLPFLLLLVLFSQAQPYSFAELDINNIKARFFANGALFYDVSQPGLSPGFEVPKGSGKSTISTARLWLAGVDVNNQLKVAAETYNLSGRDFWTGPLTTDGAATCPLNGDTAYNKVWKINKTTIDTFIAVMNGSLVIPGYIIPDAILEWPAHGDNSLNQSYYLAPFYDADSSGNYNPANGDYPLIRGDQSLFFVFNDKGNIHTETDASPIGLEIHGMAYAYNCPDDSAWNNTIFVHYDIINRGSFTLFNSYVGVWADIDIGNPLDDYIQCDVMRGCFYGLNQINTDTDYGTNPPVQAVAILDGPYQDSNGMDDTIGIGTYESLNGLGFGDGTVDNEQLGLSHFLCYNNSGLNAAQGNPVTGTDHYNYLKGRWLDNSGMVYGNNGHTSGGGIVPANFMYPSDTDPLGWGTGGNTQAQWTETINVNDPQSNRRGLGSSGSFTMFPGQITPLDIAFVYARNSGGTAASIESMNLALDNIVHGELTRVDGFTYYPDTASTCFSIANGINESPENLKSILLYPNPASETITLNSDNKINTYSVYDLNGRILMNKKLNRVNVFDINVSALADGVYLLIIETEKGTVAKKFIKN